MHNLSKIILQEKMSIFAFSRIYWKRILISTKLIRMKVEIIFYIS